MHVVTTDWIHDLVFDTHIGGFDFRIQGSAAEGERREGPGPKLLLLSSLTGCTGMDVAALMKKMRVPFTRFAVDARAELTTEHPKVYTSIHLTYRVGGPGVEAKADKVKKAVDLSLERYCGVAAMLRKHCPITFEIRYEQ